MRVENDALSSGISLVEKFLIFSKKIFVCEFYKSFKPQYFVYGDGNKLRIKCEYEYSF